MLSSSKSKLEVKLSGGSASLYQPATPISDIESLVHINVVSARTILMALLSTSSSELEIKFSGRSASLYQPEISSSGIECLVYITAVRTRAILVVLIVINQELGTRNKSQR